MARYLIAGAAGYVGALLAERLLARGDTVRGLVRDPDSEVVERLASMGMAVWQGDVTQPDTLTGLANGVEYVYNLTSRSVLENGSVRRVFVDGNRNLIAACSRARTVRSYVFAGNAAPYGDQGDAWLTEDAPVAPCYPLGEVMVEAEQAILDAVRAHRFPAIILRVGTIYGPQRDFVDAVLSGTATLIGDGTNFVARIHIDDLIVILDGVALHGQPGAIYNVADDEPARAAELYGEVRQRLGMVPPRMFSKSGALFSGLDASVVGMASASARLSNARLKQELNLTLRYPSFRTWLDERLTARPLERAVMAAG
ncbi:MAG TPA: NAD-dependent epimerase/dehydratase family protein [Roseiflexaceae bacterium]|nr:NAD-dependent epimerase/dehydratase family protein [Roseiflexaceae bacterium]